MIARGGRQDAIRQVSTVFVDSSGWIALLSRDDRLHDRARRRYEALARNASRLVTNNYVVDETRGTVRAPRTRARAIPHGTVPCGTTHSVGWLVISAMRSKSE